MDHMDHGSSNDMDMDMDMDGGKCKMQMFWNWYTIDACFMSESWRITSKGMFAGSCIGIVLLVMVVEFVRRAQREYDRKIVRQWKQSSEASMVESIETPKDKMADSLTSTLLMRGCQSNVPVFKPTVLQQLIRSLFYMVQFGAGYIIMLLVMYYNGYIFFCILIGVFLGFFAFGSDSITHTDIHPTECG